MVCGARKVGAKSVIVQRVQARAALGRAQADFASSDHIDKLRCSNKRDAAFAPPPRRSAVRCRTPVASVTWSKPRAVTAFARQVQSPSSSENGAQRRNQAITHRARFDYKAQWRPGRGAAQSPQRPTQCASRKLSPSASATAMPLRPYWHISLTLRA
jgi:hypothetical protein